MIITSWKGNDTSHIDSLPIKSPKTLSECDALVNEDSSLLIVSDETCHIISTNQPNLTIFPPLAPHRIKSLHFGYGKYSALTIQGQILLWGTFKKQETGAPNEIVESNISHPQLLPFKTKDLSCVHGYRQAGRLIFVKCMALSESKLAGVSDEGQIWTLDGLNDPLFNVPYCDTEPKLLHSIQHRTVIDIRAGRDHFAALILPNSSKNKHNANESASDALNNIQNESPPRISTIFPEVMQRKDAKNKENLDDLPRKLTPSSCPACKSESELRLSTLMKKAARTRSASVPGEVLSSPEEEPLPFCPLGLKLELFPSSPDMGLSPSHIKQTRNHADDIELRPIRMNRKSTEQFSLVSMDILMDDERALKLCMESSHSGSTQGDDFLDWSSSSANTSESGSPRKLASPEVPMEVNGVTTRKNKGRTKFMEVSVSLLPQYEVWTWGANFCGQLGLGDTIYRREPSFVERLSGTLITKLQLGDAHSLALTAAGEIYVWGSNNHGQIKQSESKCVTSPVALKLGSYSTALDISTGGNMSILHVNQELHSTVFYCGKDYHNTNQINAITVRLTHLEKLGCVSKISCCGEVVLASMHANHSMPLHSTNLNFTNMLLKSVRDHADIHALASKLKLQISPTERNVYFLMESYLNHLWQSILMLANIADESRNMLKLDSFDIQVLMRKLAHKSYISELYCVLHQLCNIVSLNAFSSIHFSDSLSGQIERLCVLHERESCKMHRRVTSLLQFPVSLVDQIASFATQRDDLGDICGLTSCISLWKNVRLQMANEIQLAERTRTFWHRNITNEYLMSMKHPSTRFVRQYDRYDRENACEITNMTCKSYKIGWIKVVLFSDCIAIIEKRQCRQMQFPLVWVTPIHHSTKFSLSLVGPEEEFVVEFDSGNSKTKFVHDFNTALFHHMNSISDVKVGTGQRSRPLVPPRKRKGTYRLSSNHKIWPNATYEGVWTDGNMNNAGCVITEDGSVFKGRFKDGHIHGFAIARIIRQGQKEETQQGWWNNSMLNGLAFIRYADGSAYEGYMLDGERHGHGVLTISAETTYIGSWAHGTRNGYGVSVTHKGKYMGMWMEDVRHGKAMNITTDGVLHYGQFERGVFINGTCCKPDGVQSTGEFNGLYMVAGKASLKLGNGITLSGTMHGDMSSMNLKITNATCSADEERLSGMDAHPAYQQFIRLIDVEDVGVSAGEKWVDIMQDLVADDTNLPTDKLWESVVAKLHHFKHIKVDKRNNNNKGKWDKLEIIPLWSGCWSLEYNALVVDYVTEALECVFHPLARLTNGICDVYNACYSSCESHPLIMNASHFELMHLINQLYQVITRLFPGIPCLQDAMEDSEPLTSPLTGFVKPVYDVVVECVMSRVYSCVHTLYMVFCRELDDKYTTKLNILNAKNDLSLLNFFDADRQLWPIELDDTHVLDAPLVCATARGKYYASAIDALQHISCVLSPFDKLQVVIRVFNKIAESMKQYSGEWHNWTADQQVPVVLYVIVRAQVSNLGAQLLFIRKWAARYIDGYGYTDQNITALESCYLHLVREKEFG